jgi:hypothetical protein
MLNKRTRIALILVTVGNLGAAAFSLGCALMAKNEFIKATSIIAQIGMDANEGMKRIQDRVSRLPPGAWESTFTPFTQ